MKQRILGPLEFFEGGYPIWVSTTIIPNDPNILRRNYVLIADTAGIV
jgi:hypothetical protein